MRNRTVGAHEDRVLATAREAFEQEMGAGATARRAAAIAALPAVDWKGHTVRTIRCAGDWQGRGGHDMHVPESLLWALLDLRSFRCVFHRW